MQSVRCGKIQEVNFDSKVVTFKIVDDERSSWYSMSYQVFLEEGLYEGMMIDEKELDSVIHQEDKKELLEMAYNALRFKDLTRSEIIDKFTKRNYESELIEEGVNEHTETFGVQVSRFFINDVIVPRKYLSAEQIRAVDKVDCASLVEALNNDIRYIVYLNDFM